MITFLKENAIAGISGSEKYKDIDGKVMFEQTNSGVLVTAKIYGLPDSNQRCMGGVFGFHIHEGGSCTGDESDPFKNVLSHYNPHGCIHPYHAGDLPPLFESGGIAYLSFLTDRFTVAEIVGKTIIIHSKPDDFTTQPSGNAGEKIACGLIEKAVIQ